MEHRIERDEEGVSPVIAVILMVAITVVLAAVLYVWAASFLEQGEDVPFAQFHGTVASNGEYYVTVITVSTTHDLEAFNYFLKDASGSTNEFGEIAMQNLSGNVVGVDASYGDKCGGSDEPACETDMSTRADAVENDSGSNYAVAFYDNDRDGKLSSGDKFTVRGSHGSGADGPAQDDWSLEVKFDNTGDVIGSKKLG